jgi:hypothetical protein
MILFKAPKEDGRSSSFSQYSEAPSRDLLSDADTALPFQLEKKSDEEDRSGESRWRS